MDNHNNNFNIIADFLFEIGTLRNMKRMHCQVLPQAKDTIASHSFEVAITGLILAKMEHADENKVLKMCLFHDMPEARIGDLNFVHSRYSDPQENKALEDQLKKLPIEKEISDIIEEYIERKTKESIIAKDADLINQIMLQCNYLQGSKDLARWNKHTSKILKTDSAKKLAKIIGKRNPFQWVYNLSGATR